MFIQTAFGNDKLFVEVSENTEYEDFVTAAAKEFNINADGISLFINEATIKPSQFKSIVSQYITVPSFYIDIKAAESVHTAASASTVSGTFSTASLSVCDSETDLSTESGPISVEKSLQNKIPTVESIKSLKDVNKIFKQFLAGKRLENRDRVKIAKTIIEDCLKDNPNKILNRHDFQSLSESIVSIFHTEFVSAYYVASTKCCVPRGKLVSAYNNKRTALSLEGAINRRPKTNLKRKASSSPSEELLESIQYLKENSSDWPTILNKWALTHTFRMSELKSKISTFDYINNYPALHGKKGIQLVRIDVKTLYPSSTDVENWLTLYPKLITRARTCRDNQVCELLGAIDGSLDERFKAQLSLLLIPYILPHSGKRSERKEGNATKNEIQNRFMREYKSINALHEETESSDVQINFIKDNNAITYAEFKIAGFTFKCGDLLEALSIGFSYIMALNVSYPKLCTHVWQFVQLSIFKIQLPNVKVPFVETIINDLFNV